MVVHTEQQFNTDHPSSVVFLLGQKQASRIFCWLMHTAKFMVALPASKGRINFGPVKVYERKKAKYIN